MYQISCMILLCITHYSVRYHIILFRVILTGHSLGGSQAQLVAAYLVHEQVVDSSSISVYTFGSPRFSDLKFAIQFDKVSLSKILE